MSRKNFYEREDTWVGKYDTGISCVIPACTGHIVEDRQRRYLGDPMHFILGPGSRNQMTSTTEHYCGECGVSYHHLPKGNYAPRKLEG